MKIIGIGIIAFFLVVLQMLVYKKYWAKNLHVSVLFRQNAIYEGEEGEPNRRTPRKTSSAMGRSPWRMV